ncbi:uncharacterized protein [Palaemon carinicauda]|uniref:uncharacterized protein n=1 Tax=Palaemon carinicauda TaxID=392227 RepID=UPI0035B62802
MRAAAEELKQVAGVTVRRADKTAAFVLINTEEYYEKLDAILADLTKFECLMSNPVEDIKWEANRTIEAINAATNAVHLPMISGDFGPGYLYGNVKTLEQGNPLRPIISQCPTPTYQLAKRLNAILTPYVPDRYCVGSYAEFLERIKDVRGEGVIASMDVESLFTNGPVDETIDLIADRVYRDETTPELNIPEQALRTLLAICTKKAPFTTHRGHMYLQKDGGVVGSPLGVVFVNFYMGVVEERVFSQVECPLAYFRYIDDTFVKATSTEALENLRRTFENNSVLQFTLENSVDNSLPFLDVLISSTNEGFHTTIYTKPTNLGMCLNGESECPARYKASTIKAFVRRALIHCLSWTDTHKELERATQVLINNGYTNKQVQCEVRAAIDKWNQEQDPQNDDNPDPDTPTNEEIVRPSANFGSEQGPESQSAEREKTLPDFLAVSAGVLTNQNSGSLPTSQPGKPCRARHTSAIRAYNLRSANQNLRLLSTNQRRDI